VLRRIGAEHPTECSNVLEDNVTEGLAALDRSGEIEYAPPGAGFAAARRLIEALRHGRGALTQVD
jgi:hypothetical protein